MALSTTTDAVTAKVLGHARKATTTDLYGHLLDADAVGVSDAVTRALAASSTDT